MANSRIVIRMIALALLWLAVATHSDESVENTDKQKEVYAEDAKEEISPEDAEEFYEDDRDDESESESDYCYDYSDYDVGPRDDDEEEEEDGKPGAGTAKAIERPAPGTAKAIEKPAPGTAKAIEKKPAQKKVTENYEYIDSDSDFVEESSDWETL